MSMEIESMSTHELSPPFLRMSLSHINALCFVMSQKFPLSPQLRGLPLRSRRTAHMRVNLLFRSCLHIESSSSPGQTLIPGALEPPRDHVSLRGLLGNTIG